MKPTKGAARQAAAKRPRKQATTRLGRLRTMVNAKTAPFKALDVKLESTAANQMSVKDAKQTGIQVDKTNYGDCVVDMNVNADITSASADALDLAVTIDVSKWTSAADKKCPTPKAEPCKVTLSMKGARQ